MTPDPWPIASDVDARVFEALATYQQGYLRDNYPAWAWHEEPTLGDLGLADDPEVTAECLRLGWALMLDHCHAIGQVQAYTHPWG